MLRPASLIPLLALALALAACETTIEQGCLSGPCGSDTAGQGAAGGDDAPDCSATPDAGSYPCEVYEVLKAKCHTCHKPPDQGGILFSLLTFEDTRVAADDGLLRVDEIRDAVETRRMPPVGITLTADEEQVLLDWLGGCGQPLPEGEGCECNDPAACP
ncbi:hypothetical protein WMF31_10470 [Sorangium sp. So ce1036]|uniref:hypothetical protein n=1 Tax=Sorangium sp. So ce1036 TaxID=3133328 RepID=UPI003F1248B4